MTLMSAMGGLQTLRAEAHPPFRIGLLNID
jgi:hypothetical protein